MAATTRNRCTHTELEHRRYLARLALPFFVHPEGEPDEVEAIVVAEMERREAEILEEHPDDPSSPRCLFPSGHEPDCLFVDGPAPDGYWDCGECRYRNADAQLVCRCCTTPR